MMVFVLERKVAATGGILVKIVEFLLIMLLISLQNKNITDKFKKPPHKHENEKYSDFIISFSHQI